jgi:hypothetical protein
VNALEVAEGYRRKNEDAWEKDCLHWRGRVLVGDHAHWCREWDGLPIDETTPEWPCACATPAHAPGR